MPAQESVSFPFFNLKLKVLQWGRPSLKEWTS